MGEDGPEILPIGSPLIDAVDPEAGNLLGIEARQTLGITPSARVLFYSSVVPSAFTSGGVDTTINDSTFAATLNGMRLAAERNPSQDFVLLLRMHPRMKGVYAFPNPTDLPTNLKLIGADHLSYDETVYAADIIACNPLSTEVIVAPYRGRGSVVLAYEGEKQFGEAIEGLYGSGSGAFLSDECGLSLVRSEDMLATAVETYTPVAAKPKPTQKSLTQLSATLLTS